MHDHYHRYLAYLQRHRQFVLEEAIKLYIPDRGLTHDLSKFSPEEFGPYADYFYGGHERANVPADVQYAFDYAWVLREDDSATKMLMMPEDALRELLADWRGAGRAILGDKADTPAWYAQHRDRILLHPDSRAWIEHALTHY